MRLYFKRLDEQAPTNTTTPTLATLDGNRVTDFTPLPGFDGRSGSSYTVYNRNFQYLDYDNGGVKSAEVQGIHPRVTGISGQIHYDFNDNISLDDTIRYQWISGNFTTQFINVQTLTGTGGLIGSTVNGQTGGSVRHAAGAQTRPVFTCPHVVNKPDVQYCVQEPDHILSQQC